jgi:regulatory protein
VSLRPLGAPRGATPGSKPSPPRERPSAYLAALRRLALRDRSIDEVRSTLLRRGYEEAETGEALERLIQEGLLNDSRLAREVARSRMATSGLGRFRVRQELDRRGLPRETTDAGIGQALSELSEPGLLDGAALRYWRVNARVPVETRLRRLYGFLLRRGFPSALVHERLRTLFPDVTPFPAEDLA